MWGQRTPRLPPVDYLKPPPLLREEIPRSRSLLTGSETCKYRASLSRHAIEHTSLKRASESRKMSNPASWTHPQYSFFQTSLDRLHGNPWGPGAITQRTHGCFSPCPLWIQQDKGAMLRTTRPWAPSLQKSLCRAASSRSIPGDRRVDPWMTSSPQPQPQPQKASSGPRDEARSRCTKPQSPHTRNRTRTPVRCRMQSFTSWETDRWNLQGPGRKT